MSLKTKGPPPTGSRREGATAGRAHLRVHRRVGPQVIARTPRRHSGRLTIWLPRTAVSVDHFHVISMAHHPAQRRPGRPPNSSRGCFRRLGLGRVRRALGTVDTKEPWAGRFLRGLPRNSDLDIRAGWKRRSFGLAATPLPLDASAQTETHRCIDARLDPTRRLGRLAT